MTLFSAPYLLCGSVVLINTDMDKEFIRVRSVGDILISSSLILGGTALIALAENEGITIAGFFMIMTGMLFAFLLKTGYMDSVSKERYRKKEIFFQHAMYPALSSALTSKPESVDLAEADKGSAIRLDVYFNRATGKAYLQLFEYVPHSYQPCSSIHEHDLNRVERLIR